MAPELSVRAAPARAVTVQRRLVVGAARDPLEREAERVADDVLRSIPAGGLRSGALVGGAETRVRRSSGSASHLAAPAVPSSEVGFEGGAVSDEVATRIRRAHGEGRPLDEGTRAAMEPAFGVSFADVRVHCDSAIPARISAAAFTVGSDVHVAHGLYWPTERDGQHLLAHELAHVVQQGGGGASAQRTSVDGDADLIGVTRTEPKIQRRDTKFKPFKAAGRAKQNVDVTALALDTLHDHGLRYPTGGTIGNDVNLEKMISDTGGGSAPGAPVDFDRLRMVWPPLVWARNQTQAATAMHAINHNFADPLLTNLRPDNIFMGSAASNTDLHFYKVELPIRDSMKQATAGAAVAYQNALLAHHPTPSTQDPQVLLWNQPGMYLPGAFVHTTPLTGAHAAPLPQATHSIDLDALFDSVASGGWPKVIQYRVVPLYTYQAYPNFPPFLLHNIAISELDIADEQLKATPDLAAIARVQAAEARLKVIGEDLFPEDFRCTAVYWFPSYDPAQPWYQSSDTDIYSAER